MIFIDIKFSYVRKYWFFITSYARLIANRRNKKLNNEKNIKTIANSIRDLCERNKVVLSVLFFFWSLFALTNNGWDSSEGSYGAYLLAENIVKHGDLGSNIPLSYLFNIAPNGKYYLVHEIGNAAFMLPTAFINITIEKKFSNFISLENISLVKKFVLSFQSSVYSALSATFFFAILRIGFSQAIYSSFLATLGMVTTTYFWAYSRNLYDGVLCTTLLTASFYFIIKYRQKTNLFYLFVCFICLGLGLITRMSMILALVATLFYLISTSRRSLRVKECSIAMISILPFLLWQAWYNNLRTGIFYKSPVQICCPENNALDGNLIVGIGGLLFSPGKSFFIYVPVVILSIVLFRKFYKEYQKEAIYVAVLTTLWFLLHGKLRSWYGAAGLGPRHFLTVVPILWLPTAVNLNYILKTAKLRIFAILLAGFGLILSMAAIVTSWPFRLVYAESQQRVSDNIFIWGVWNSQAIDLLQGAWENIRRILYSTPIIKFPSGASETYFYTNSTINIWPNALIHAGISWYLVSFLVILLLSLIFWSLGNILKAESQ